jgi:hypothetical protein
LILLGVLILLVLGLGYGLYTRQGSGISKHPRADSQDPVVDDDEDHLDERAGVDRTESAEMDQRGTQ